MRSQYRTLNAAMSSTLTDETFRIQTMKLLAKRLATLYDAMPDLEGDRGQIGISKASGASRSVVNQWLSGAIKSMDINYALRIEGALGVSHIWLMTGLGPMMATPGEAVQIVVEGAAEAARLTLALPMELDLLDLFRRSTARGQLDILETSRNAEKLPAAGLRAHQG